MTAIDRLIKDMQELKKTKLYASSFKCIDDCLFLAEYYKKEEPKQEISEDDYLNKLIEDANKEWSLDAKLAKQVAIKYAKWQAERMYSEEEVFKLICDFNYDLQIDEVKDIKEWFEQVKKRYYE